MKLRATHPCRSANRAPRDRAALSLIEVMIAMTIFFMVIFAILSMVSSGLRNARSLQETSVDAPGALAAFLFSSNRLDEGVYSGDFGDLYPDYKYDFEVTPVTNGLMHVEMAVHGGSGKRAAVSILVFEVRPPGQQQTGLPQRMFR